MKIEINYFHVYVQIDEEPVTRKRNLCHKVIIKDQRKDNELLRFIKERALKEEST